ncbi:hypothetical protein TNCV_3251421 [Trichonephila clavipes]|nr:hypothetical protein TNCV_3251421 [Trichonephila clavipes]
MHIDISFTEDEGNAAFGDVITVGRRSCFPRTATGNVQSKDEKKKTIRRSSRIAQWTDSTSEHLTDLESTGSVI